MLDHLLLKNITEIATASRFGIGDLTLSDLNRKDFELMERWSRPTERKINLVQMIADIRRTEPEYR